MQYRYSPEWSTNELADIERRVLEINARIDVQRQIIEESEQRGYDVTSSKIVLESLLVSLSLSERACQRLRSMLNANSAEVRAA
jgi:hypothetical protein